MNENKNENEPNLANQLSHDFQFVYNIEEKRGESLGVYRIGKKKISNRKINSIHSDKYGNRQQNSKFTTLVLYEFTCLTQFISANCLLS